jgi:hypothetical protein
LSGDEKQAVAAKRVWIPYHFSFKAVQPDFHHIEPLVNLEFCVGKILTACLSVVQNRHQSQKGHELGHPRQVRGAGTGPKHVTISDESWAMENAKDLMVVLKVNTNQSFTGLLGRQTRHEIPELDLIGVSWST